MCMEGPKEQVADSNENYELPWNPNKQQIHRPESSVMQVIIWEIVEKSKNKQFLHVDIMSSLRI